MFLKYVSQSNTENQELFVVASFITFNYFISSSELLSNILMTSVQLFRAAVLIFVLPPSFFSLLGERMEGIKT